MDVIDYAARKLHVSKELFSRAGLKDRYSLSTQYLSFRGNIKKIVRENNFTLTPIGKSKNMIKPDMLFGNSFSITLRNLIEPEIDRLNINYDSVIEYGFPNYFDEQRFGSARHKKGFFAKKLILRHYEGALKLLLSHPYKEDSRRTKNFKNFCKENWGRWQACYDRATIQYRPILRYLINHPRNFKNSIKKIDRQLLNIYLLAYQSYLFNNMLASTIQELGENNITLPYSMGKFVFYNNLKNLELLKYLKIPLINERTKSEGFMANVINKVLQEEAITLTGFALKKMRFRDVRFKSFLRSAIVFPRAFIIEKLEDDEIYVNKKKVTLKFILPLALMPQF